MRADHERASVRRHHLFDVREAVDMHAGERRGDRLADRTTHLDGDHAEMLKRAVRHPAPLRGRHLGERLRDVRERQYPAARHRHPDQVPDAPPDGACHRQGQSPGQGDEGVDHYAERRFRSFSTSITIGTSDRTMTTTTTMWM